MSHKANIRADRWYVALETASCTTGANPGDFVTVHQDERRHGSDPVLQHPAVRQFFVDEAEVTPEQRAAIRRERQLAERESQRAEEKRREEKSRRIAAEEREQRRVEAAKRVVHVQPAGTYDPRAVNPLTPGAVPPTVQLAAAVAEALDKGDGA